MQTQARSYLEACNSWKEGLLRVFPFTKGNAREPVKSFSFFFKIWLAQPHVNLIFKTNETIRPLCSSVNFVSINYFINDLHFVSTAFHDGFSQPF